jgi:hypothetical protein
LFIGKFTLHFLHSLKLVLYDGYTMFTLFLLVIRRDRTITPPLQIENPAPVGDELSRRRQGARLCGTPIVSAARLCRADEVIE